MLPRRDYLAEVVIVLWVSLGAGAVRAGLNLVNRLTSGVPLNQQQTTLVESITPDRPWLDVAYQLSFIVLPLGAVALVWYLLHRSGDSFTSIGFDTSEPGRDLWRGTVLAAVVGGVGLGFYLFAYRAGLSVDIAAVAVSGGWWEWPLLLGQALMNSVLEEVVVLGFVLLRLTQAGLSRDESYRLVQRNAMKVWESDGQLSLLELLKADADVTARLTAAQLTELFDLGYHMKHVDTIFDRVFGAA